MGLGISLYLKIKDHEKSQDILIMRALHMGIAFNQRVWEELIVKKRDDFRSVVNCLLSDTYGKTGVFTQSQKMRKSLEGTTSQIIC